MSDQSWTAVEAYFESELIGADAVLEAALAVARAGQVVWRETTSSTLQMRSFSDPFLDAYLARNRLAALSSVGAYELEGEGVQLFERIDGDYFAILGLPLLGLLAFLRNEGVLAR